MGKPVYTNRQVIDQIDSGALRTAGASVARTNTRGITTMCACFPFNHGKYSGLPTFDANQFIVLLSVYSIHRIVSERRAAGSYYKFLNIDLTASKLAAAIVSSNPGRVSSAPIDSNAWDPASMRCE
ncbi:MAG: hypothetical protein K0U66_00860 [Gammaproteobacteria bacterium]|nr:hypothetical protein [Gammaproteobacteria bacterium]